MKERYLIPFKSTTQQSSKRREEDEQEEETHEQANKSREEASYDLFMHTPLKSTSTLSMCVTNEEILKNLKALEKWFKKAIDNLEKQQHGGISNGIRDQ